MVRTIKLVGVTALAFFSASVFANPIPGDTCGEPGRIGTLTGADQCAFADDPGVIDANGTLSADNLTTLYGDTWSEEGEITDADGTDGYLTATSNEGWGAMPNSGTWAIDASFWEQYEFAIITIHVGGGQVNPDNWAWLIGDGETSGTWSIDWHPNCDDPIMELNCNGGGLSNIKLWGAGEIEVSEPGTLALLGIGLLGLGLRRRRVLAV